MKKIIASALVLALTIGAAQAQSTSTANHPSHHKREHRFEAFKKLNLTAEQKTQLKTIRQDFRKQAAELKKQDQLTVAEMRKRRQELHKEFRSKAESVLTAEQKTQLAKIRAERKEKNSVAFNKNHHGRQFHRGAAVAKQLNLTPDQKDKLKEMRSGFKSQMETVKNDQSLSMDQKKEKVKELRKQQMEQMKTVLTKEQVEKLQSLRKEHKMENAK